MTEVLKVNKYKPERSKIKKAADIIKKGGIVAFPTETVYGLGASAFNADATKKVFIAKQRPLDNPLIIHIADKSDIKLLSRQITPKAKSLIDNFWPGPLTIVVKKKETVPDEVTAGGDTVAIRMPANKIALELIKASGVPLVAPSANLSTMPSPTCVRDVITDLHGKVDLIIDGGLTSIGIESTVIDMTASPPQILRCGGLSVEDLESVIGNVLVVFPSTIEAAIKEDITAKSPGLKYRHYAPKAKLILMEDKDYKKKINKMIDDSVKAKKKVGVITFHRGNVYKGCTTRFAGSKPETVAKRLFGILRWFDSKSVDLIISEPYYTKKGLGYGIIERLKKATGLM